MCAEVNTVNIYHFLSHSVLYHQVPLSPYEWTKSFHICAEVNTVNIYAYMYEEIQSIRIFRALCVCRSETLRIARVFAKTVDIPCAYKHVAQVCVCVCVFV